MTCTQQKGLKDFFMGVLEQSVIEDQNKQLKNRLRVVGKKDILFALAAVIVLVCVIREGEVTMCNDVASAGSWNID